jgi:regulator of protease activity HflC (stomatin/prohibitin superfamily)
MPTQWSIVLLLLAGALGLMAIVSLFATLFTVEQRTTAIVQRLGRFIREAGPGLHVVQIAQDARETRHKP